MKNPIKEIRQKIKVAKISGIIFAIVFLALIVNSICLTYKVHQLEKQNHTGYEKHDSNKFGDKKCGDKEDHKCFKN